MKNTKHLLFLFVLSLFIANCGKLPTPPETTPLPDDGSQNSPEPVTPPEAQDPSRNKDPVIANIVCYLGELKNNQHCYETTSTNQMTNPEEYKYKNAQGRVGRPQQYQKPYHILDLDSLDLNAYVSPNFQVGEFLVRFKGQYGILAPILIEKLQSIRESIGSALLVNSGYRSPAYNDSVGGATFSRHMYGDAVDMWSKGKTLEELKDECLEKGASFYQLYRSHIHCDWRNHPLHSAFYTPKVDEPQTTLDPYAIFEHKTSIQYIKGQNLVVVSHPHSEDEGDLLYKWTIITKDQELTVTNYQPSLKIDHYDNVKVVRVAIGGSVTISTHIK